jgi:hypothetical protein
MTFQLFQHQPFLMIAAGAYANLAFILFAAGNRYLPNDLHSHPCAPAASLLGKPEPAEQPRYTDPQACPAAREPHDVSAV